MLPWLICGGLAAIVIALLVKLWLLRRSLDEIARQLGERLTQDTNSPIFLSTRDAHARRLAAELNTHLKELRRQRQRFQQGDTELKNAITTTCAPLLPPFRATWTCWSGRSRPKTPGAIWTAFRTGWRP